MSLDELRATLAAGVRAEMARKGKTQRDLATFLDIDQQAISLRCRGERSFRAEELVAIGVWLDVPVSRFAPAADVIA